MIRYTEYGIPHIVAKDCTNLGFGTGWAQAADQVCVLADGFVTLRGDRSRFSGPDAATDFSLSDASDNRGKEGARAHRGESNEDALLPPVLGEADVRLLLMGLVAVDHAPESLSRLRQKVRVAVRHRIALACQFVPTRSRTPGHAPESQLHIF